MRHRQIRISTVLLIALGLIAGLQSQTTISATGGNATGSGGSASYSVGQIFYNTNTGTNGSVAEGVQQPFEISVVSGIEEAKGIILKASVYPNPATDYLILEVKDFEFSDLRFHLYDMQGKLLESTKITANQTKILLNHLLPASYLVKVIQARKEIKVFKVIKN